MRELDKISDNLFNKIRSKFENINLGDENAKATSNPAKARFYNFDYIGKDGKNFGNVTISIVDETSIKVYFSKNITDGLDNEQQDEWFNFLRDVRKFARTNFLTFDARDINKSNLDLRDIKQQSKADSTFTQQDVAVTESRMWGTTRSSYQEMGPARIIVRHSTNVDEEVRGERARLGGEDTVLGIAVIGAEHPEPTDQDRHFRRREPEKLGPVGQGQSIEARAVALLQQA